MIINIILVVNCLNVYYKILMCADIPFFAVINSKIKKKKKINLLNLHVLLDYVTLQYMSVHVIGH